MLEVIASTHSEDLHRGKYTVNNAAINHRINGGAAIVWRKRTMKCDCSRVRESSVGALVDSMDVKKRFYVFFYFGHVF